MSDYRVLFAGLGSLGSLILDALARIPGKYTFLVGEGTALQIPGMCEQISVNDT